MTQRSSTISRLPSPPDEYDPTYMNRLVASIEQGLQTNNGRRAILGTTANFSTLPTSPTGLRPGDLWRDGDVIKIV